jgi:hypothetical protein
MKKNVIISSLIIVFATACAQHEKVANESNDATTDSELTQKSQLASVPQTDLYSDGKTKLIKTATYRFEVENVKQSTEAITVAIKKYPAYISSSSLHLENPILENRMTIRVQNEYFQELLKDIDMQAVFVNVRDVSTQDVSKEFVDLDSRLKTKREVEERYMEILRKKAGTIEELLNAEQQIGELHEEIEATISRINYLKEQVSYSTINLEFYQTISQDLHASNETSAKDQFSHALKTGWTGVVAIAVALTYIWPLIIVMVVIFVILRHRTFRKMGTKPV